MKNKFLLTLQAALQAGLTKSVFALALFMALGITQQTNAHVFHHDDDYYYDDEYPHRHGLLGATVGGAFDVTGAAVNAAGNTAGATVDVATGRPYRYHRMRRLEAENADLAEENEALREQQLEQ